jgi:peptidoglycan/LPS O-acetylase OafA/YrhL
MISMMSALVGHGAQHRTSKNLKVIENPPPSHSRHCVPLMTSNDDPQNHFDALRLISAFAIIISHYFALRDGNNDLEPFHRLSGVCNIGKVVTYVCFVISGELVTRAYLRKPAVVRFLLRRAIRVLPALWVCIFVSVGVGAVLTTIPPHQYWNASQTRHFIANGLLYPNHYNLPGLLNQFAEDDPRNAVNGSLWVIPPLFLMYVSLPLLDLLRLLRRPGTLLLIAALMLVAWESLELHGLSPQSRFYKYHTWLLFIPHLAFFFYCGVAAAAWGKRLPLSFSVFVLLLAMIGISFWLRHGQSLVLTLCLPYLTLYLGFARLPGVRALDRMGCIALGVYLYSYPVQHLFMHFRWRNFSVTEQMLYPCIVCAGIGILSWWLIESPLMRLIAKNRDGQPLNLLAPMSKAA